MNRVLPAGRRWREEESIKDLEEPRGPENVHPQGRQSVPFPRLLRDSSLAVLPLESSETPPPAPTPIFKNLLPRHHLRADVHRRQA